MTTRMTMITRGEIARDWIEIFTYVPEGMAHGQYLALRDYQERIIRRIYDNDGCGGIEQLDEPLSEHDRAALELAVRQVRTSSPERETQIENLLAWRDWFAVARMCSAARQFETLHLKPMDTPPAWIDNPRAPQFRRTKAGELRRRMTRYGVSRFDPDPETAIAIARKAKAKPRIEDR